MTVLKAQSLTCTIGNRTIVSGVNVSITSNTMTAIVGVNGVGKSTLMRVLAGIRRAAHGHVEVDGHDIAALTPRQRARQLAFVAQEEAAPEDLTLTEMVALGRLPHLMPWQVGGSKERKIVAEALELVGLSKLAHRRCDHLSGGERRRAMLAKGLAQGTELLLLDEPTNHLDVHHQIHLLEAMRNTGRTIVATIHDLDLAVGWFDQIIVLANGGVLTSGPPSEVMSPATLETAFKVRSRQVPPIPGGVPHLVIDGLVPVDQADPSPHE
ncbi:MAG: ABC transporter ATP-binding protein [Propionibacteriaceae bacterium]|nr:ABC transporter ATP-binding protein [Propionibacteriaceae bacterium]